MEKPLPPSSRGRERQSLPHQAGRQRTKPQTSDNRRLPASIQSSQRKERSSQRTTKLAPVLEKICKYVADDLGDHEIDTPKRLAREECKSADCSPLHRQPDGRAT